MGLFNWMAKKVDVGTVSACEFELVEALKFQRMQSYKDRFIPQLATSFSSARDTYSKLIRRGQDTGEYIKDSAVELKDNAKVRSKVDKASGEAMNIVSNWLMLRGIELGERHGIAKRAGKLADDYERFLEKWAMSHDSKAVEKLGELLAEIMYWLVNSESLNPVMRHMEFGSYVVTLVRQWQSVRGEKILADNSMINFILQSASKPQGFAESEKVLSILTEQVRYSNFLLDGPVVLLNAFTLPFELLLDSGKNSEKVIDYNEARDTHHVPFIEP